VGEAVASGPGVGSDVVAIGGLLDGGAGAPDTIEPGKASTVAPTMSAVASRFRARLKRIGFASDPERVGRRLRRTP
jgi:hypothetical protein